jgi:heme exporter protein A
LSQIDVVGLEKKYHYQPVLDNLSITLADGDFCVLVGANGAGKTTLLRILATLVQPDDGEITLDGEWLGVRPVQRQRIGYLGHQAMFYHDLSAVENLAHYARLYRCPHPSERVQKELCLAGLETHQAQPVRTFSRGMLQRLAIARALLHDPDILLLDEPYTGLDKEAALALDRRLMELHQPGRVIFLAAHRPQRLIHLASHIAWLQNGKISPHLPVADLKSAPDLQAYLQEAP